MPILPTPAFYGVALTASVDLRVALPRWQTRSLAFSARSRLSSEQMNVMPQRLPLVAALTGVLTELPAHVQMQLQLQHEQIVAGCKGCSSMAVTQGQNDSYGSCIMVCCTIGIEIYMAELQCHYIELPPLYNLINMNFVGFPIS